MKEKFINFGIFLSVFLLSVGLTLAAVSNYITVSGTATVKQLTTVTLYSTVDSFIEQADPDDNNNDKTYLSVKSYATSNTNLRSLVQFDLSSIPSGVTITSATLNLYYYLKGDYDSAGRTYWVYRLTNLWVESEVTWNSRNTGSSWTTPGGDYSTNNGASSAVPSSFGWMSWDVTNLVSDWINGQPNHGILILDENEDSVNSYYTRFYSREGTEVPYLTVTYVV